MCSGVSSYSPNSFGSPAFGWALTNTGATRESSCTYCRSAWAPSAQLSPTLSGRACATEFQNASVVWPDSVRPLASTIVPEIITGSRRPSRSNSASTAKMRRLGVEGVEDGLDQDAGRPRRRSVPRAPSV